VNIATHFCPYASRRIITQAPRWWGTMYTWELPLRHGPVLQHRPLPARRVPQRASGMQGARWKRRRFIQKLRRST
jgi:hypothetical protein